MTFAAQARRLAGLAGVLLGWTPDTFWRATPEELATLIEALAGDQPASACGRDLEHLMEMFPDG